MKTVSVCLVGCGRAGMVHAYNLRTARSGAELVAAVEADSKRGQSVAEELGISRVFTTLEQALEAVDFDVVIIATPTFAHAAQTVEAAEAGKHVFSEKPLCVTLEEADQIDAALAGNRVKYQIGFMRRFDESYQRAKQLLDDGTIGEPILAKSVTRGPGLPPDWYADQRKSNGLLAEVNSHDFDAMRWIMGREYHRAFAWARNFKCPQYRADYPHFHDTAVVNLQFEDGTLGMLDGCCPATYGYDARMEILGSEGLIMIGTRHPYTTVVWNRDRNLVRDGNPSWRTLFRHAYQAELAHFIDCVREDRTPTVGVEAGRKALEAVLAANLSIRTGEPVKLAAVRK